ncbi:hypothetical protein MGH68_06715 [Erysipelothrix sp. D19-032]
MLEVANDKTTIEVPSPVTGLVKSIFIDDGNIATVGQVLVEIDVDDAWAAKTGFKIEGEAHVETEPKFQWPRFRQSSCCTKRRCSLS